jgi:hypothetical protein
MTGAVRGALGAIVGGSLLALALAGAPASAAAASVDGCKLMAAAIKAHAVWPLVLTEYDYERTTEPPGVVCTWNEKRKESSVGLVHHLSLYFFVAPSAAAARAALRTRLVVSTKRALRGTGADEAYAKETQGPHATFTSVAWRKDRYWGQMLVAGPRLSGDLDDARELLALLMRRLPRG